MIFDIIAGIASGLLGAMGFGGGGILILYLTICKNINQLNSQGINLMFFIPIGAIALIVHTKNKLINWKTAIKYIIGGTIGVIIGYMILSMIPENYLQKLFAIILLTIGIKGLIQSIEIKS